MDKKAIKEDCNHSKATQHIVGREVNMEFFSNRKTDIKFVLGSSIFTLLMGTVGYLALILAQSMLNII
jgi:hypothetical protein